MTAHTTGPWSVEKHGNDPSRQMVVVRSPKHLAQIATVYENAEANARLIAAAPDLLEALKGVVKNGMAEHAVTRHFAWDKARAAIAKATGVK